MRIEWMNKSIDKFKPWYDDLGNELTQLEEVFVENSPSKDSLWKLNPNNIDLKHLPTTYNYLSKFVNNPEVWDIIVSLRWQIEQIINNGNKKVRLSIMKAANDDIEMDLAV